MRETSAAVIQRCLAILQRLQRGPASRAELIEAAGYEDAPAPLLAKRFEADKKRLSDFFNVKWRYSRATQTYELVDAWAGLFDVSDTAVNALAFLQTTFEPDAPMADAVQEFLGVLVSYLPPERRNALQRLRATLEVEWGQHDDDVIDADAEAKIRRAVVQRRLIAFDYYSPSQADGLPRRHTVEPWGLSFIAVWGHYYLRGYCRYTDNELHGREIQRQYVYYRLGRIRNVEVLPDKLPATPPTVFPQPLQYRLAASIARTGSVTRHPGITILRTERQDDGSVMVYAETDNVWWAVRALLHYGATCEVLGGPEALAEMRRTVAAMAAVYEGRERER